MELPTILVQIGITGWGHAAWVAIEVIGILAIGSHIAKEGYNLFK